MKIKASQSLIGSAIAFVIATSCCWVPWLAVVIGSAAGISSLNAGLSQLSWPFGIVGFAFLGYGAYQLRKKNSNIQLKKDVILDSTITCPECGHQETETMPTDACQYFYECAQCKTILKPLDGDCCVYCSYGDVPCPPIQMDKHCC